MNQSPQLIAITLIAASASPVIAEVAAMPNPLDFPGQGPVGPLLPPIIINPPDVTGDPILAGAAYSLTPVYPAPGGTIFSGSGSSGQTAGRTNFYSGFDESQYEELAWSFITIPNPYHSSEADSGGNMTYSGYNATTGIMTWISTSNATWSTASGTQDIATRLVAQFQPFTGTASGPLGAGWLVPTTAATEALESVFGGAAGWPLVDVDATGTEDQFQVWYRFETSGGTPLLSYYDASNSLGGILNTNTNGGFLAAVPEPSASLLGLIGAGLLLRRRRA
jgi:hypothetical protein